MTFTRVTNTYDSATDTVTPVTTTMTGSGIRVGGNPITYQQLSLRESEAPTILWTPTTYGDTPAPGDTVTIGSTTYTVRDVYPIAPDFVTICARIVVSR